MKKARNVVLALLCALLLIAGSVAGTLAYLTDTTKVVNNTFTAGNVTITLDEGKVNEYGLSVDENGDLLEGEVSAPRVQGNEYKLIPGHNYSKDPMIHVDADSEECWLFVKVTNGIKEIEADDDAENGIWTIHTQMVNNGWTLIDAENGIYAYEVTVTGENNGSVTVFTNFTIAGDADVADYIDKTITVIAYAVQADGFDTPEKAWEAAPSSWTPDP